MGRGVLDRPVIEPGDDVWVETQLRVLATYGATRSL